MGRERKYEEERNMRGGERGEGEMRLREEERGREEERRGEEEGEMRRGGG